MSTVSSDNDWQNPLPGIPDVESPFFDDLFSRKTGHPGWFEMAQHFREHGFAVVDFPDEQFETLSDQIRADLNSEYDWEYWKGQGWSDGKGLRVQDAWRQSQAVQQIAANTIILDLLGYLYGRKAWPFQTLNFPVGTQQHFHTDAVHFSSIPERFMCGVWVALEDIDETNGPLIYYPGSHKLPIYVNEHIGNFADDPHTTGQNTFEPMWRELMRVHGIEPKQFHAKKGQALIWSSNLFHGGQKQLDPNRTRWSQVTHYYFDDCVYYTPLHSDLAYGRMLVRDMDDIATGKPVDNKYLGHRMPEDFKRRLQIGKPSLETLPRDFKKENYLNLNPDVKDANVDPAEHYLMYGNAEGRSYKP